MILLKRLFRWVADKVKTIYNKGQNIINEIKMKIKRYWDNALEWMKRAADKVIEVTGKAIYGVKMYIKKVAGNVLKQISKNYAQDEQNRWKETIVTRVVSENEVPEEILRKAAQYEHEIEVSKELELQFD